MKASITNPAITLLAATLALGLAACNNDNRADDAPRTTAGGTAATTDGMTTDEPVTATGTPGMGTDGTAAGQHAEGDRKALMAVEEVDRHEIAAAEDALAKNVEGDVRRYAETLRDDHTRNLDATRRLMGAAGGNAGMGANPGATGAGSMGAGTGAAGAAPTGAAGTTGAGAAAAGATHGMHGGDAELTAMREKHEAERQRLSALEGQAFATAWVQAMVTGHEEALAKLDNELIPGASDEAVARHLRDTRTSIAGHLETARTLQANNR
ncbi:DUF4142 domain-containing protein [Luteimonas deserti]|uniref:DUF4142 domain-containing protein n=1 Tax=Luteimonas deserti TaxID=2752306 RepID=A0A7Z0QMW6_9GAMM|nr:DUF4142 domain-containing protein [Luteimonas deserti]NYZ61586.1 DUF4142 domain-containing protein [Luteimonas deserti]